MKKDVPLYLVLVHHPIINKRGEMITTSVTNLDLHDIARTCRTFGFKRYFVVTPLEVQHQLLGRILGYWQTDGACDYNPDRQDALELIRVVKDLEGVVEEIKNIEKGNKPIMAMTGAKMQLPDGDCNLLIDRARELNQPVLLVLGTGWGLHPEVVAMADFRLNPIPSAADYNHLSVRSAAAIYAARLSQVNLP